MKLKELAHPLFQLPKPPDNKDLISRVSAPTPSFFQKLRNAGLIIAALGGFILSSPVVLPAIVITIAVYMAAIGGAISAVSQDTVQGG